jgi:hypothetical protein
MSPTQNYSFSLLFQTREIRYMFSLSLFPVSLSPISSKPNSPLRPKMYYNFLAFEASYCSHEWAYGPYVVWFFVPLESNGSSEHEPWLI